MFKSNILLGAMFCALCSFTAFAVDIPQVDMESQEYNSDMCVDNNTQNCINAQCLTSEETDCQDQCATMAKAQCEQQVAE